MALLLAGMVTFVFVFKVYLISYIHTEQYFQAVADVNSIIDREVGSDIVDPWGNKYKISSDRKFVYSFGADQVDNSGEGDDITDHEKVYDCETYGVDCNYPNIYTVFLVSTLFFCVVLCAIEFIKCRLNAQTS